MSIRTIKKRKNKTCRKRKLKIGGKPTASQKKGAQKKGAQKKGASPSQKKKGASPSSASQKRRTPKEGAPKRRAPKVDIDENIEEDIKFLINYYKKVAASERERGNSVKEKKALARANRDKVVPFIINFKEQANNNPDWRQLMYDKLIARYGVEPDSVKKSMEEAAAAEAKERQTALSRSQAKAAAGKEPLDELRKEAKRRRHQGKTEINAIWGTIESSIEQKKLNIDAGKLTQGELSSMVKRNIDFLIKNGSLTGTPMLSVHQFLINIDTFGGKGEHKDGQKYKPTSNFWKGQFLSRSSQSTYTFAYKCHKLMDLCTEIQGLDEYKYWCKIELMMNIFIDSITVYYLYSTSFKYIIDASNYFPTLLVHWLINMLKTLDFFESCRINVDDLSDSVKQLLLFINSIESPELTDDQNKKLWGITYNIFHFSYLNLINYNSDPANPGIRDQSLEASAENITAYIKDAIPKVEELWRASTEIDQRLPTGGSGAERVSGVRTSESIQEREEARKVAAEELRRNIEELHSNIGNFNNSNLEDYNQLYQEYNQLFKEFNNSNRFEESLSSDLNTKLAQIKRQLDSIRRLSNLNEGIDELSEQAEDLYMEALIVRDPGMKAKLNIEHKKLLSEYTEYLDQVNQLSDEELKDELNGKLDYIKDKLEQIKAVLEAGGITAEDLQAELDALRPNTPTGTNTDIYDLVERLINQLQILNDFKSGIIAIYERPE